MGKDAQLPDCIMYCCQGSKCKKNGASEITKQLKKEIKSQDLKQNIWVIKTLCTGHCEKGPIISIQPDNIWYKKVSEKDVTDIVDLHSKKGRVLEKKLLYPKETISTE